MTELSQDLWTVVLRYVPLAERLGSCALVCRTFHAAAVSATQTITATITEQSAEDNLVQYLHQHGSLVTSITAIWQGVFSDLGFLMVLPSCPHLQELSLSCFNVQQDPQQQFPLLIETVTGLTRLELDEFWVHPDPMGGAAALSVLVNLQHLSVAFRDYLHRPQPPALSGIGWSTMQHLTQLRLDWVAPEAEDLQHISSMSRLEVLRFGGIARLAPDIAPGFCLSATLRDLDLETLDLNASVLAAAALLSSLKLHHITVCAEGGVSGGECLLQLLAGLRQLEVLSLQELDTAWPPLSAAYQGFTASSKLRVLALRECLVQPGVFAHMFPAAHEHYCEIRALQDFVFVDNDAACGPADVVRLVSSCPGLQGLQLEVQGGAHLTTLSQLSALTSLLLDINADHSNTAMSIKSLTGLTRLRDLGFWLFQADTGTAPDLLLPLTALTQLDELGWEGAAAGLGDDQLQTLAGPGQPPDVWLQLLERCAADSECQPAISRNLAQQLAQQEALTRRQQQELTDLRQQLAEQEAIISQQQQDLTDLRQQLAEQDAPNSQQQQDLTDLRQQLAEQDAPNSQQQQELTDLRQQLTACLEEEAANSQQQQDATDLRQQLAEQQQLNVALQQQVVGHSAQLQALEAKFQQLLRL